MSNSTKITDENNEHRFFCILQNVLSRIGLTAFERSIYWAIKECCGEHGTCTKSYAKLAIMSGMSIDSVRRALLKLSEINEKLGKPLIRIIHRVTECGDRDTNEIIIVDIWNDNIRICQQTGGSTQQPPTSTKIPGGSGQTGGVVADSDQGGSTQPYKEEPFNKNPMNKIPPPPTSSVSKSGGGGGDLKKAIEFAKFCLSREIKLEERLIKEMYQKHPQAAINTMIKLEARIKKNEKLPDNLGGWFRREVRDEHDYLEEKKHMEL